MTGPAHSEPDPARSGHLRTLLDTARTEHGLVGLGAVIATSEDGIVALAVTGDRVQGGDPVEENDAWHIGSNTKMLTALTWARLVESGSARWGMTLDEIFEGEDLHPGWRDVTIEDLLSHRSGAAPNPGMGWTLGAMMSRAPAQAQRAKLVSATLGKAPAGKRGTFTYSNLGYILAGRAIEVQADRAGNSGPQTYEELVGALVIARAPEGAGQGFGFGPPESGIQGHRKGMFGGLRPAGTGAEADNPSAFASAGTAHISLKGQARLLLSFLEGPGALPPAMRRKLMTPYPDAGADYALGWGIGRDAEGGTLYLHAGSNTMWLSQVVLAPEPGAVIIINTNQTGPGADAAIRELTGTLLDWAKDDFR
ncbi:serine hydrolase domain-containing protein [Hyphomonas sp.]|uniref:serine hydrolase domain-containing protein n=1 Tax=Hyphomonas sp. TaxID=87 RepID=UPI001BCD0277|nr:serine hydrolase domain-containing protein [Hyphomonas sp.]